MTYWSTSKLLFVFFGLPRTPVRLKKNIMYRKSYDMFTSEEYQQQLKKPKRIKLAKPVALPKPKVSFKEIIPDDFSKLKYKKLSNIPGNVFNKIIYGVRTSSYRDNLNICLLNGTALISEAIKAGCPVSSIYFNRLQKLEALPFDILRKTHLTHYPDRLLKDFPGKVCDGVFALACKQDAKVRQKIVDRRSAAERKREFSMIPLTLVCNSISESEEMGKVLQAAANTGCKQVYLLENNIDIWGTEVLNAAFGAHFKIPIISNISWNKLEKLVGSQHVYFPSPNSNEIKLADFSPKDEIADHSKSENFINMLERESSKGTLPADMEEDVLSNTVIPSEPYDQVDFCQPNIVIVGKVDVDVFYLAVKARGKDSKSCGINVSTALTEDHSSVLTQTNVLLYEARRQKMKRK
ncbi:rRNA methyltransferase 3, mitochondrial-like [Clavelina lepadiformis]|uniref:rRNA methyltransferase 3, mitochondrial-like n=1 Tax=Clavelina lepadiformis TaxID=159417 RepID=UPI004042760C